jgi:hypothetical protein
VLPTLTSQASRPKKTKPKGGNTEKSREREKEGSWKEMKANRGPKHMKNWERIQ